jgi:hypothetical protein
VREGDDGSSRGRFDGCVSWDGEADMMMMMLLLLLLYL